MSDWTEYVKRFAQLNDITYACALSMPECKQGYKVYKNRMARKLDTHLFKKSSLVKQPVKLGITQKDQSIFKDFAKRLMQRKKLDQLYIASTPLRQQEYEKQQQMIMVRPKKLSKAAEEPKPSKKISKHEKISGGDYEAVIDSWNDIDQFIFPIEIDQNPVGKLLLDAIRNVKGGYIFPFLLFYTPELRKLFELLYLHFEEKGIYKAFEIIHDGIVVLFDYLMSYYEISEDKEIVPFLNKNSGDNVFELIDQYSKELPMRLRAKILKSEESKKLKSVKIK